MPAIEMELDIKQIGLIIIVLICIVLILVIAYAVMTGGSIRDLVASILFFIPFGSIYSSLTQGLGAIPG